MLASGVPLNRTRAEVKSGNTRRPDLAWKNAHMHRWSLATPHAGAEQKRVQFQALSAQWVGMSDQQRRAAVFELGREPNLSHVAGADADAELHARVAQRDWTSGDDRWPVSPAVIDRYFRGAKGGLVKRAQDARWHPLEIQQCFSITA